MAQERRRRLGLGPERVERASATRSPSSPASRTGMAARSSPPRPAPRRSPAGGRGRGIDGSGVHVGRGDGALGHGVEVEREDRHPPMAERRDVRRGFPRAAPVVHQQRGHGGSPHPARAAGRAGPRLGQAHEQLPLALHAEEHEAVHQRALDVPGRALAVEAETSASPAPRSSQTRESADTIAAPRGRRRSSRAAAWWRRRWR